MFSAKETKTNVIHQQSTLKAQKNKNRSKYLTFKKVFRTAVISAHKELCSI